MCECTSERETFVNGFGYHQDSRKVLDCNLTLFLHLHKFAPPEDGGESSLIVHHYSKSYASSPKLAVFQREW